MFIADLPESLRCGGGKGVNLYDVWLQILMYADDGAIVAESAEDLQCMLDSLYLYCNKWRLIVNTAKTEIMIFNADCKKGLHKNVEFNFNNVPLRLVSESKYLGVIFHTSGKLNRMIAHRIEQGKRVLAAWKRRCQYWLFNGKMRIRLFKTCVLPAFEYSVNVWGSGLYKSNIWKEVESYWRYIAKYIAGVPCRTPTLAVYGDLGWLPFYVRAADQAVKFWVRVTKLNDDCLVRKAMHVQRDLVKSKPSCICWLSKLRDTLCQTVCGHRFWNEWFFNDMNFRKICSRSVTTEVTKPFMVAWEDDFFNEFCKLESDKWSDSVNLV